MSYSINAIIQPYKDRNNEQRILLQIIINRQKFYTPIIYKIKAEHFANGFAISGKKKSAINAEISRRSEEVEELVIWAIKNNKLKAEDIKRLLAGKKDKILFEEYADQFISRARITESTRQMYRSIRNVVADAFPDLTLDEMDLEFMQRLEKSQESKSHNTIHKILKKTKTILYAAAEDGLIKKDQFEKYAPPAYDQKIPEYLTEPEIQRFTQAIDLSSNPMQRLCGYYFLLSCYSGLRLSDARGFRYHDRVKDGRLILKAKKNGSIISMPIHKRLKPVLEYIQDKPIKISEQHIRHYVYELAKEAGIDRRIKYHTSRHTFAMWLMDNDFSIEDVAELLGNDLESARIYGRISNKRIEKKIAKL